MMIMDTEGLCGDDLDNGGKYCRVGGRLFGLWPVSVCVLSAHLELEGGVGDVLL